MMNYSLKRHCYTQNKESNIKQTGLNNLTICSQEEEGWILSSRKLLLMHRFCIITWYKCVITNTILKGLCAP